MSKYGHRPQNWFEAIVNKLGGEEAAERFLRGELVVHEQSRLWGEKSGAIFFQVASDGTTGPNWIKRLEKKGIEISGWAKDILNSSDFKPTSSITYEVGVLKGDLFSDRDRTIDNVRKEGVRRNMILPGVEIACLIRDKFTNKEIEYMGLEEIATAHDPIKDSGGRMNLLCVGGGGHGDWLNAISPNPTTGWPVDFGFALVSSV